MEKKEIVVERSRGGYAGDSVWEKVRFHCSGTQRWTTMRGGIELIIIGVNKAAVTPWRSGDEMCRNSTIM
jgi:hypothetical protein